MTTQTKTVLGITLVLLLGAALYITIRSGSTSLGGGLPIATVQYGCNSGKSIKASFYAGTSTTPVEAGAPPVPSGKAVVELMGAAPQTLMQTISADGGRYATADESLVFWSKGRTALVLQHGVQKDYVGCIELAPDTLGVNYPRGYVNSTFGFSLRLPSLVASTSNALDSYTLDEQYVYRNLGPTKTILGVKFMVPKNMATGTNLSSDSYISVEQKSGVVSCVPTLFLEYTPTTVSVEDGGVAYAVASTTGAGAGNRYEETVFTIPGTNPCMAVRYFVHSSVFENYPVGTVVEFDKRSLLAQFDTIRRSLVLAQ